MVEIAVRALRVVKPGHVELVDDVPIPEPGPDEVLLRVMAAGLCHSDLEIREAPAALGVPVPLTLGHEIAGRVEKLGAGVSGVEVGRFVTVYPLTGCGHCACCRRGEDNICRTALFTSLGVQRDGGLADYVVVPARNVVDAAGIGPVEAATCTDAGLTAYRAIALGLGMQPDATTILVTGIGGLGHLALQVLKARTDATVVAVDTDDAKLQLARRLGADHTVLAGAGAAGQVMDIAGGRLVDLALDFVAVQPTLDLARDVTGNGGSIVIPGVGGGTLAVNARLGDRMANEVSAMRTVNGSRQDFTEVLDLARTGRLHTQVTTFPLDRAVDALQRLEHGEIAGRAVVLFDRT